MRRHQNEWQKIIKGKASWKDEATRPSYKNVPGASPKNYYTCSADAEQLQNLNAQSILNTVKPFTRATLNINLQVKCPSSEPRPALCASLRGAVEMQCDMSQEPPCNLQAAIAIRLRHHVHIHAAIDCDLHPRIAGDGGGTDYARNDPDPQPPHAHTHLIRSGSSERSVGN